MSGMDGDHTAKQMDQGANLATNAQDMIAGLHEDASQKLGAGDKATGHGTSVFSKDGAVGSAFTTAGSLGGTAQKIGGPFDQSGSIGKQFTTGGSIGGAAQNLAEKNEQH